MHTKKEEINKNSRIKEMKKNRRYAKCFFLQYIICTHRNHYKKYKMIMKDDKAANVSGIVKYFYTYSHSVLIRTTIFREKKKKKLFLIDLYSEY